VVEKELDGQCETARKASRMCGITQEGTERVIEITQPAHTAQTGRVGSRSVGRTDGGRDGAAESLGVLGVVNGIPRKFFGEFLEVLPGQGVQLLLIKQTVALLKFGNRTEGRPRGMGVETGAKKEVGQG
jgi:hypothetical protein